MIVNTGQFSVSTTPVKVVSANEVGRIVHLNCKTNEDIYISGDNTVSTSTGFYIPKGNHLFQVQIDANDELWCIVPTGTHTVTVMTVTQ